MARSTLSSTALPAVSAEGLNLTDASFSTFSTGSNNGYKFDCRDGDLVILKNGTGGAATFTLKVPTPATLTAVGGGSVTDSSITVADGDTHIIKMDQDALKQSDGLVYLDCDVAATIILLRIGG